LKDIVKIWRKNLQIRKSSKHQEQMDKPENHKIFKRISNMKIKKEKIMK